MRAILVILNSFAGLAFMDAVKQEFNTSESEGYSSRLTAYLSHVFPSRLDGSSLLPSNDTNTTNFLGSPSYGRLHHDEAPHNPKYFPFIQEVLNQPFHHCVYDEKLCTGKSGTQIKQQYVEFGAPIKIECFTCEKDHIKSLQTAHLIQKRDTFFDKPLGLRKESSKAADDTQTPLYSQVLHEEYDSNNTNQIFGFSRTGSSIEFAPSKEPPIYAKGITVGHLHQLDQNVTIDSRILTNIDVLYRDIPKFQVLYKHYEDVNMITIGLEEENKTENLKLKISWNEWSCCSACCCPELICGIMESASNCSSLKSYKSRIGYLSLFKLNKNLTLQNKNLDKLFSMKPYSTDGVPVFSSLLQRHFPTEFDIILKTMIPAYMENYGGNYISYSGIGQFLETKDCKNDSQKLDCTKLTECRFGTSSMLDGFRAKPPPDPEPCSNVTVVVIREMSIVINPPVNVLQRYQLDIESVNSAVLQKINWTHNYEKIAKYNTSFSCDKQKDNFFLDENGADLLARLSKKELERGQIVIAELEGYFKVEIVFRDYTEIRSEADLKWVIGVAIISAGVVIALTLVVVAIFPPRSDGTGQFFFSKDDNAEKLFTSRTDVRRDDFKLVSEEAPPGMEFGYTVRHKLPFHLANPATHLLFFNERTCNAKNNYRVSFFGVQKLVEAGLPYQVKCEACLAGFQGFPTYFYVFPERDVFLPYKNLLFENRVESGDRLYCKNNDCKKTPRISPLLASLFSGTEAILKDTIATQYFGRWTGEQASTESDRIFQGKPDGEFYIEPMWYNYARSQDVNATDKYSPFGVKGLSLMCAVEIDGEIRPSNVIINVDSIGKPHPDRRNSMDLFKYGHYEKWSSGSEKLEKNDGINLKCFINWEPWSCCSACCCPASLCGVRETASTCSAVLSSKSRRGFLSIRKIDPDKKVMLKKNSQNIENLLGVPPYSLSGIAVYSTLLNQANFSSEYPELQKLIKDFAKHALSLSYKIGSGVFLETKSCKGDPEVEDCWLWAKCHGIDLGGRETVNMAVDPCNDVTFRDILVGFESIKIKWVYGIVLRPDLNEVIVTSITPLMMKQRIDILLSNKRLVQVTFFDVLTPDKTEAVFTTVIIWGWSHLEWLNALRLQVSCCARPRNGLRGSLAYSSFNLNSSATATH
ncbi:unnamed protein product [Caenorhabditis auriculariae]|uniref:Uncharacterized protein n=1 Tax=Caenorhabditis auriculariae TaxID=2777116 RepID=A0A8S1GQ13_9PELO|nr:unnamed protein product [Caenorhabditis auriculariae]